jgi:hypothetical protein
MTREYTDLDKVLLTAYELQCTDQHDRAITLYSQMMDLYRELPTALQDTLLPQYHCMHHNRGLVYFSLKRYSEAVADLTAAVKLDPKCYNSHIALAQSAEQNPSLVETAFEHYALAQQLQPTNAETFLYRAMLYHTLDKKMQAVEDCTSALGVVSADKKMIKLWAHIVRGDSYKFAYGLYQKQAMSDYERAMAIDAERAQKHIGRGFTKGDPLGHSKNLRADCATPLVLRPTPTDLKLPPVGQPQSPPKEAEPASESGEPVKDKEQPEASQPPAAATKPKAAPPSKKPTLPALRLAPLPEIQPESPPRSYRRPWLEPTAPKTDRPKAKYVRHEPVKLDDLSTTRAKYRRPWAEPIPPPDAVAAPVPFGTPSHAPTAQASPRTARPRMITASKHVHAHGPQKAASMSPSPPKLLMPERNANTALVHSSRQRALEYAQKIKELPPPPPAPKPTMVPLDSESPYAEPLVSRLDLKPLFDKLLPIQSGSARHASNEMRMREMDAEFMLLVEERLLFSLSKHKKTRVPPASLQRFLAKIKAHESRDRSAKAKKAREDRRESMLRDMPFDFCEYLLKIELNHPELGVSFDEADVDALVRYIARELEPRSRVHLVNVFEMPNNAHAGHAQQVSTSAPPAADSTVSE